MFTFYKIESEKSANCFSTNKGEWITVTVTNDKSDLWLINTYTESKEKLLDKKDVLVSGVVNSTGDTLIYSDAIGTNPWDVFKLDIKTKETAQITNDYLGQFNLHFGDEKGNIIFAKSGGKSSPNPQIAKIDITKNEGEFLIPDTDVAIQDFDVGNNKIVAIKFSYSKFITKRFKEQDNSSKIKYSIIEMDENGENVNELLSIHAINLHSISFSASGDDMILGGKGLINNEVGFYKFNLQEKNINPLLTEEELKKDSKINNFSQPYKGCLSSDEKNIYFVAVPADTKEITFSGISTHTNALYKYNFEEKEVTEIFKLPDAFIPSISCTYQ